MKLRSLTVNQFKKFTRTMCLDDIGDGLNVVVGPNEMGKSTLLDALRAVLFEKYSSKAAPVRALQNHRNQAAPVVALEFELEDGLYRIAKRFVKDPYARLSCPDGRELQSDEAEETLRKILGFDEPGQKGAKPETLGMWNVLWVQQGHSFGALDLPGSAQSDLHNALESEVGEILGGKRGRAIPQEIDRQLEKLVTKKNNQPRGDYKESIDLVADLRDSLDKLQGRRNDLTQTLDELETAEEKLKRLSSESHGEANQKDLDEARQRFSQLEKIEASIETAAKEREIREGKLEQAEQASATRQQRKDDIQQAKADFEAAGKQLIEVSKQEEEARLQYDTSRVHVHDTEEKFNKVEEVVSRQRRVLEVVERDGRIQQLENQCKKAQAAETSLRKAQQDIAAILVTDTAIRDIRKADKNLETVKSRLSAAATRITFEMKPKQLAGIKVNDRNLAPKQLFVEAVEPAIISVPDHGQIRVEPAIDDRDKLLDQQDKAKEKLKSVLEKFGVKTLDDAEEQYKIRQELLQDASIAEKEAKLHAPATDEYAAGGVALANHIEGLRKILKREMDELDLREIPNRQESEKALRVARTQAEELQNASRTARAALIGPEEALGQLKTNLGIVKARHDESKKQLEKLQRQLATDQETHSDNDLQTAIETAHAALSEQKRTITDLEAQRTEETLPQLKARIGRLENAIQGRQKRRGDLEVKIAGLESRIEVAGGAGLDEVIGEETRKMEFAEEDLRRHKRELQVLGLLRSTLRNAEQQAKERYLSPVLKRIRPYLQTLFPGAEIRIDETLRITGIMRETGYEEKFDHLSMGTQEQIAVLVRLTFAEMLASQGHPATIVLDDALVFSDDQRMGRMFDILNMASNNVQVIILTCREQLFEGLGGKMLSLTETDAEELKSA